MSRTFRILAALAVLGSCLAAALSGAIVARAASTLRDDTRLLDAPNWDAGVVLMLPAGTEIAIAGAPDGSFLPVKAGDVSGWVPSSAVAAEKAPQPAAQWEEPLASSAAQPADGAPPATEELPSVPPTPAAPEPDPAAPDANSPTDAPPATDAVPPAAGVPESPPAGPTEPAPATNPTATPAAGEAGWTPQGETPNPDGAPAATASPPASSPLPTPPPPATSSPTPLPSPTPTPVPTPEPLVNGPATVATDAGLLEWPGFDAPIVFMVPAGSLVNLQGEARNGFVQAEFMWMYGWIADDLLQPAAPPEEEAIPDDAEATEVRTPRAGSGFAFATVDLTMRAGPSAGEEAVGSVPAGARVELTGVMQNDFQRVIYQDQIGWIANEFLQLPATPTPETSGRGKGRNGSNNRAHYSERQIIRIISNAADRYGQNREDMLRVARCESGLDPYAVNPSGSYGLFQFIRSTWKSTPYGNEDIFDPVANANAAGWMWKEGRKSEWVCK